MIYAVEWIAQLAEVANRLRIEKDINFLLVNPEPDIRYNTVNGWNCNNQGFPAQLLALGNDPSNNFDRQDIHLHMPDMGTLVKAATKVQKCTNLSFITTEWSQASIVQTSGWLKAPCALNSSISNGDFINACCT